GCADPRASSIRARSPGATAAFALRGCAMPCSTSCTSAPSRPRAPSRRLPALAELGVTHVELMPVGEFPGHHGWGYDGVYVSAAHSAYGGPHGLARFVDAAHAAGLGVILDVVYNHVGASGVNALEAFGPFFTERHETPWGKAVNFDGEGSDGVREWVLQSATGWVRDF